ncbi:dTDP-4-dehydrorhamnose reductase [Alteromonas sp. ASW11-130]|uniref:dTDP-4-dehydrorhamnose reductase n=1 Tax=Alteromonas sp. ASW11-130 TaxID=3015775 RepID=UPI002242A409|nr:dTDP-4-dehydrorhamnose reductase [Alteromonas sp. ASW11-130]MCW8090794.1 dTDP-4-dehydrorhamnose reductase [Alteromonas sp. ASW11-130]
MTILVIGKSGQLAYELKQVAGDDVICLGRNEVDITNKESLYETLNKVKPAAVINASAYTAVDKAESEPKVAELINVRGVANLAAVCKKASVFLVHVSTDYVFNGHKGAPYTVDDKIEPQGVYGKTKAEGEKALLDNLPDSSCLIRTAWVYSVHGTNFVKTMLRLMADKPQLGVIDDQVGTPTWARGLAEACLFAAKNRVHGVYHWTDEGVCSWYDFAFAIQELGVEKGLLEQAVPLLPIPSLQYPTPAKRPHYSVLDKSTTRETFSSIRPSYWRTQLSAMLDELKTNQSAEK